VRFQTPAELAAALEPFAVDTAGWPPSPEGSIAQENLAPHAPVEEGLHTPLPGVQSDGELQFSPTEEASALINTLAPDVSPTLLSGTRYVSVARSRVSQAERRRLKVAIAVAVAVVAGLVGLAAMLAVF
jgi:hypothetical protein